MTWIKTEDQLPEHGQRVLALAKGDFLPHTTTFFTDKWITSAGYTVHDTTQTYDLWQPIPTRATNEAPFEEKT
jgi:hypothetical protein